MIYELHLTVTPVESCRDSLTQAAEGWKFSCFDEDEVDGIAGKWFLTTHRALGTTAHSDIFKTASSLRELGFNVERAKIERVMFDTKTGDIV